MFGISLVYLWNVHSLELTLKSCVLFYFRNKRSSPKRESTKSEPLKVIQAEPDSTTAVAADEETGNTASVETAQPTVQVTPTSEDEKPKRTKGKRAPPRASKRTTRRTTRSMSTTQKRSVASSNDESSTEGMDESAADDSSQNSRPKRGRKAKKAKTETVAGSEGDVEGTAANTSRPTRSTRSKAAASTKYVDHVKRLINVHEKMISDHSSEDEFQSPKRRKVESEKQAENSGVLVPETPEKETEDVSTNTPVKKFFPPVANVREEEAEEKVSSKEEEEVQAASSPDKVTEDSKTDTDDDSDTACVVEAIAEREPSPEKVAPLAEEEDLESSQEEAVAEPEVAEPVVAEPEVAEEDTPKEDDDEQQNQAESADEEEISDSMEQDSLNNVSVASSSRSTRSRTSVRGSVRRSNRPSVLASKSKKKSVVGRRSSLMRTVTRSKRESRVSMKRLSRMAVVPPLMENLDGHSENEEEEEHLTPVTEAPRKPVIDPTTQTRRMTRYRIQIM